jgi:hypothetical protein
VRTSHLPNEVLPEGRAYFAQHTAIRVIQTALVENPALYVNRINEQFWAGSGRAHWTTQPSAPPETQIETHMATAAPLDIDTAGLIEDLLAPPPPKSQKAGRKSKKI